MNRTITAVVPVKANSSRLPGKNILPFGNSNLLLHKIEQLKQVDEISRKKIPDAYNSFMRQCRLKNLSPYEVSFSGP